MTILLLACYSQVLFELENTLNQYSQFSFHYKTCRIFFSQAHIFTLTQYFKLTINRSVLHNTSSPFKGQKTSRKCFLTWKVPVFPSLTYFLTDFTTIWVHVHLISLAILTWCPLANVWRPAKPRSLLKSGSGIEVQLQEK